MWLNDFECFLADNDLITAIVFNWAVEKSPLQKIAWLLFKESKNNSNGNFVACHHG